MSPSPQAHLLAAIRRGPAFLPQDLLEGSRASQFRALKAHANTISHARFLALEDTYPRTRVLLGDQAFHELASDFLGHSEPISRPLRLIGKGFADTIPEAVARDLARVEYAWLEAHGAAEAPAVLLERLKAVSPDALVNANVLRHPASRSVPLTRPGAFAWDQVEGDEPVVLITRPEAQVLVSRVGVHEQALLDLARAPVTFGDLLARDAQAATTLVRAGALTFQLEIVL